MLDSPIVQPVIPMTLTERTGTDTGTVTARNAGL